MRTQTYDHVATDPHLDLHLHNYTPTYRHAYTPTPTHLFTCIAYTTVHTIYTAYSPMQPMHLHSLCDYTAIHINYLPPHLYAYA